MSKVIIIPAVKSYLDKKQKINFKKLSIDEQLNDFHYDLLKNHLDEKSKNKIIFVKKESLNKQAYEIIVNKNNIKCFYLDDESKHNAILTLHQMLKQKRNLTTCIIKDEPNFEIRSIMIDISRNKVPTLKTLKEIVDQLALVKINDVQLYIEGRSFFFESYPQFYENKDDFLTGEDVTILREYCKNKGITLTPNTNCFGHMAYWLNQKEFNHLALKKDGFRWSENGLRGYAATIDPNKKEAKELVYNLFEDLLKYYPNCERFTVGGDEPFELLFPKKQENARELYENHMVEVINYVNDKNIVPCMWGDVVKEYPEMLEKFKNVVFFEWGYEAGHFNDEKCSFYEKQNKDFLVCCGTSCWLSLSGRMDNMFANYQEAAFYGKKYHAKGMVITDWNDGASLSQLTTLITCYIYGACYAYSNKVNKDEVKTYLDKNVYHAPLTNHIIELGRYNVLQEKPSPNMTRLFIMLYSCQIDGINLDIDAYSDCAALFNRQDVLSYDECVKTKAFLDKWYENFKINNKSQFIKELMFTYQVVRHALNLNFAYIGLKNITCTSQEIKELLNDINDIIKKYPKIWFYRNKKSDFKQSMYRFKMLRQKYINLLYLMEGDL